MKRFLILLAAVVSLSGAYAQDESMGTGSGASSDQRVVCTNRFVNNWEFGFSLGTQFYMGEYDYKADFMDWWATPAFNLSLTKWASPMVGVGADFQYIRYKGLRFPDDKNATFYSADDEQYKEMAFKSCQGAYMSVDIYGVFDITNIFRGGYNPSSRYNLSAYVGAGLLVATQTDVSRCGAAVQMGLRNQWKLNDRWSIDATLRGSLINEEFDGELWYNVQQRNHEEAESVPLDGALGIMLGASYRFGFDKKDPAAYTWIPLIDTVSVEVVREVPVVDNKMLDKVAAAATYAGVDVERLTSDKALADRAQTNAPRYAEYVSRKEDTKTVYNPFWIPIHFAIDKYNITHYEEVSIIAAADAIKALPEGMKVNVTGYADIQTASPVYNQALSKRRADAVADMLVNKYGVDRDRLVITAMGGVENMWLNDNKVSRCVVISYGEK